MSEETITADDAEISVLGAAMSGANVDEISRTGLQPSDFRDPFRGDIWAAILRVHDAGNTPDVIQVRLAYDADNKRPCDPIALFRMTELVPVISSAAWYAQQVTNAAGHRAIVNAGIKVTQLGQTIGDLDERREAARQAVDEACKGRNVTRARTLADVLPSVIETAEHGAASAIGTGWSDVDELIGGLAPGRLLVVGARPGVGKSLMGTNLALHVAHRHEHAALIASMEMPEDEVGQRLLATHANVNLTSLATGKVTEPEWASIAAKHAEMAALPITIDDTPGQSVQHIRGRARDIQRTRDDLALIVVDYIQLMQTGGRSDNRAQELAEVSRGLKLLARESGACVVALAQVNREAARRDSRPRMSDLRESGAIEADADQVILLHQPDDNIPRIEVIVDKNRHGPKGIRTLDVWGHYARLVQPAWQPSGAIA